MRRQRSTRKLHVYKRKSKKTSRRVKRRNKQSIKRRNYRGGVKNILPYINQNDIQRYKHMLLNLDYLNNIGETYYFKIKYIGAGTIQTNSFNYNKTNNTLNIDSVTNENMKSLLNNNNGHILDFINTKI